MFFFFYTICHGHCFSDESIRTHERTRQSTLDDRTEVISETLQERLDELPSPEKPERDISIVTLKKHPQDGLGMSRVSLPPLLLPPTAACLLLLTARLPRQ